LEATGASQTALQRLCLVPIKIPQQHIEMATQTLKFAPGERNVTDAQFSTSVVLFWLRTLIGASSTRVVTRAPNTIFGIIPLGYQDAAYPLSNVASVGVNARFSVGKLVAGLIALFVGFALIGSSPIAGLIVLLIAVALLANVMKAALVIQNNGGGITYVDVSILQKAKLEEFREGINERLFADHAHLRHGEQMSVQNAQLYTQQQQLNAQIMAQQAALQQQQPGASAPQPGPSPQLDEPTG
jgi:hypothetical protein